MASDVSNDFGGLPGYEFVRHLGRGGMGVVYLARQLSLGRLVAIKVLPPIPRAEMAEQTARFRREAELMARLTHPNVVAIHDSGLADGRPFLVMEYIEGGDLKRQLVPDRPLDPARVRALIGPITRALVELHRNGILHRDLKPSNILMRDGQTPKLADFGIAVLGGSVGDMTRPGLAPGTPGYVAPEQQYGLKVDERCDQYSLAAVAYELLTGRRPLGPFGPPSRHHRGLSRAVDDAIMRALTEDRNGRFATVEEFAEALDRGLASSRPLPLGRRWVWAGVGAVALIGVGVLTVSSRPGQQAAHAPVTALSTLTPSIPPPETAIPAPKPAPPAASAKTNKPPPERFQNGVGMKMLLILPGEFEMGSPENDPDATLDERPRHRVRITRPYYLAECEVTNRQFLAFVEEEGYKTEAEQTGLGGYRYDAQAKDLVRKPNWNFRNPGYKQPPGADEPVVQVTWGDATAFCNWLAKNEGLPYRLPTEAEWEYACRAGTTTRWITGDDPAKLDQVAWTQRNAGHRLHPVGLKASNPWGLKDMHGNAWEWCDDWFGPYPSSIVTDPTGPARGNKRALRGGSWDFSGVVRTRSASRIPDPPDRAHFTHGFRVAIGLRGTP